MSVLVVPTTSTVAFLLGHLSGDPAAAIAGEGASPADVEAVRHLYGFDRPLFTQYLEWLGRVLGGDFGRSFYLRVEVSQLLAEHMPVTVTLGPMALGFEVLLSIPIGVIADLWPTNHIDRISQLNAVAAKAMQAFLLSPGRMELFGAGNEQS